MKKTTLLLLIVLNSLIAYNQQIDFDPFKVLKDEYLIDLYKVHTLDSSSYIVDARKNKSGLISFVQYFIEYDEANNDFSYKILDKIKGELYYKSVYHYFRFNNEVSRIRQEKEENKFVLYIDKLVDLGFKKGAQPFFSSDSLDVESSTLFLRSDEKFFFITNFNGIFPAKKEGNLQKIVYEFDQLNKQLIFFQNLNNLDGRKILYFKQGFISNNILTLIYYTEKNGGKITVSQLKENKIETFEHQEQLTKIGEIYPKHSFYENIRDVRFPISRSHIDDKGDISLNIVDYRVPYEVLIQDYFEDSTSKKAKNSIRTWFGGIITPKRYYYYDRKIDDNGDQYLFLLAINRYELYTDILVFKIHEDDVLWCKQIRRGSLWTTNSTSDNEHLPKSVYPEISLSKDGIYIKTIDQEKFYNENGEYIPYLKENINTSKAESFDIEILINKENGTIKRKIIK